MSHITGGSLVNGEKSKSVKGGAGASSSAI